MEYDFLATGHYAKIHNNNLLIPKDKNKDQTYFLAQVNKKHFAKIIFPLQDLTKPEVRKIASEIGLNVSTKKDSTGICFIGERNFTKFLQNYIPSMPGEIIDITNNKVVGKHIGAMYYTLGQRKGLNLGGMTEPYYVASNDLVKKIIYVAPISQMDYLKSNRALIKNINVISDEFPNEDLMVKFRYRSLAVKVLSLKHINDDELEITYDPFLAVTPGQQAVFYKNDICIGGGEIERVYTLK